MMSDDAEQIHAFPATGRAGATAARAGGARYDRR